jgi:hypothetical protein
LSILLNPLKGLLQLKTGIGIVKGCPAPGGCVDTLILISTLVLILTHALQERPAPGDPFRCGPHGFSEGIWLLPVLSFL